MIALIKKHAAKSIIFGIVMTVIGFFRGWTVFTFPPVWLDLLKLFFLYAIVFLVISVLFDWISGKIKKNKK